MSAPPKSFCPGSKPGSMPITRSPATCSTKGSSVRRSFSPRSITKRDGSKVSNLPSAMISTTGRFTVISPPARSSEKISFRANSTSPRTTSLLSQLTPFTPITTRLTHHRPGSNIRFRRRTLGLPPTSPPPAVSEPPVRVGPRTAVRRHQPVRPDLPDTQRHRARRLCSAIRRAAHLPRRADPALLAPATAPYSCCFKLGFLKRLEADRERPRRNSFHRQAVHECRCRRQRRAAALARCLSVELGGDYRQAL